MKCRGKSITKLLKICLISNLLITISLAHVVRAQGSVRHSTRTTTRVFRQPPSSARVGRRRTVLPLHYRTVVVRGSDYYYSDGVFYHRGPPRYVVVVAPVGAVVATRPRGSVTIRVADNYYYYYNGAYYVTALGGIPVNGGYAVVEPPVGATVPYLPKGSTTVYISGNRHYAYGGVHYRPYSHGGRVVYRVVKV
jgi:hypothetical protein